MSRPFRNQYFRSGCIFCKHSKLSRIFLFCYRLLLKKEILVNLHLTWNTQAPEQVNIPGSKFIVVHSCFQFQLEFTIDFLQEHALTQTKGGRRGRRGNIIDAATPQWSVEWRVEEWSNQGVGPRPFDACLSEGNNSDCMAALLIVFCSKNEVEQPFCVPIEV